MANLTEKMELLDAISIRSLDIKKRCMAMIHAENVLADDIDRLREIFSADFGLRDEARAEAEAADRKKKERLAKSSASPPSKKRKQDKTGESS